MCACAFSITVLYEDSFPFGAGSVNETNENLKSTNSIDFGYPMQKSFKNIKIKSKSSHRNNISVLVWVISVDYLKKYFAETRGQ